MGSYKQTLLREDAYNQLVAAKSALFSLYKKRITISDVINLLVGKKLNLLSLPKEMQDYIFGFTKLASENANVLGVMLFGSVARGTYNRYSDIDILVMVKGRGADHMRSVHEIVQKANPLADRLAAKGIYSYITPIVLGSSDLKRFSPLYISLMEEGITLFDRDGAVGRFISNVAKIHYEKAELGGEAIIRWRLGSN